ncbi:TIGR03545 family protein [bacterium]|jgi:uncharacterized protein (TIGR03545 family)|nr:TIGR03545 family protein [bacterium]
MRWKAVIPFLILLGCLISPLFFLDTIIETAIVRGGQSVAQAKVSVEDVIVHYSPLSVEVTGVVIANAQSPMSNLVEIDRVQASVLMWPLFKKKLIIPEMTMTGVVVGTKRYTSGALPKKNPTQASSSGQSSEWMKTATHSIGGQLPKLDINVTDLIDPQQLQLARQGKEVEGEVTRLRVAVAQLSDFSDMISEIDQATSELTALKSFSIGAISDITQLNTLIQSTKKVKRSLRDIQKDLTLRRTHLSRAREKVSTEIARVKVAGNSDFKRLEKEIQFKKDQVGAISQSLLSDWIDEQLAPHMSMIKRVLMIKNKLSSGQSIDKKGRLKGTTVSFPTIDAFPGFWIQKIRVSGDDGNGQTIKGTITDIAMDQSLINKPMIGIFAFSNGPHLGINGQVMIRHDARRGPASLVAKAAMTGLPLAGIEPFELDGHPMTIQSGRGQVDLLLALRGDAIQGSLVLIGNQLRMDSGKYAPINQSVNGLVISTVKGMKKVKVEVSISGDVESPSMTVRSSFDRYFRSKINKMIGNEVEVTKRKLKDHLDGLVEMEQSEGRAMAQSSVAKIEMLLDTQNQKLSEVSRSIDSIEKEAQNKLNVLKDQSARVLQKASSDVQGQLKKSLNGLF